MRSNKIEEVLDKDKSHKGFTLAKNRPFAQIPWATQESLKKIERFNAITSWNSVWFFKGEEW